MNPRLLLVVKRDCPTCTLIEPVYRELATAGSALVVYSQDDPDFPAELGPSPGAEIVDDRELEHSYRLRIQTVPTLIQMEDEEEIERTEGWDRSAWESVTGLTGLGAGLPDFRPGCGSRSVEPGVAEALAVRFGDAPLTARRIELESPRDDVEACFDFGWTDGLPVVPPTEVRVVVMLGGTTRDADEVIGEIPPNLAPCTVEKVAVNAVMAGCRPEYMPVVLAAVEAALEPAFCMHGLLCTTYFSGPVIIVNGPAGKRIGMNAGVNVLGQGNRANATIGRALQLVIRNVGGGVPGGVDRATMGQPGKYTFCFAEDESDPEWMPLHASRGLPRDRSAVTLYAGDGITPIFDQLSRTPQSLTASLAAALQVVGHPKKAQANDAMLVISPEHYRVYRDAGWDRARIVAELEQALVRPGRELVRGAGGIAEGMPASLEGTTLTKFRPGGLNLIRAGGSAGLMSAIIGSWVAAGEKGSELVTQEIGS